MRLALLVCALHAVWIGAFFASGHEVRDFIKIGPRFVLASHASSIIRYDPSYGYPTRHDNPAGSPGGFDGQFPYYIALDPSKARYYIAAPAGHDSPAYRYERILYPMLARLLAIEQPSAIPWTLLLINWLACGGGVLALASWLKRKGTMPWPAVLYGLYPGMLLALQDDLTEPLAFALVAAAIYLFDFGGRRGVVYAGAAFGLAALTRETTAVFAILFALSILAGRPNAATPSTGRWRLIQAASFGALALLPLAAWLAIDFSWLGVPSVGRSDLTLLPFSGPFGNPFGLTHQPVEVAFVALPVLAFGAVVLVGFRHGPGRTERLCLLANAAIVVGFSSDQIWISYTSIGRVAVSVMLSAIICLPYLGKESRRPGRSIVMPMRPVLICAGILAMAMIPAVLYYGFWTTRTRPIASRPSVGYTARRLDAVVLARATSIPLHLDV